jgi:putative acetyltransferase
MESVNPVNLVNPVKRLLCSSQKYSSSGLRAFVVDREAEYNARVKIRTACNDDCAAVRELVFAVLAEYGLRGDPAGTDADIADIEASYIVRGGCFEVVEDDAGTLAGCAGMYPSEQHSGAIELRKMYLKSATRGRGIGKQLIERALAFARQRGFRRVELETSSKLVEAIGLYKKYGFQPVVDGRPCDRCDQVMALEFEP